ncbi:MAG: hypothetical protein AABX55_02360 [Nanoarchaeota archaeon]
MKKGTETLTFVFSLIFLALILTFYFLIFSTVATKTVETKIVSLNSISDNINLLNYLRTPTNINNFTISDLIIYSYYNKDYQDLEGLSENIFNKIYLENKCPVWILNAKIKDEEFFDVDSDFSLEQLRGGVRYNILQLFGVEPLRYTNAQISIPSFNQDKIKISLITGCLR